MDPISHALVGAVIGSLAAPGASVLEYVAIAAAVVPDADIIVRVVAGRRAYLDWHRSVTHSTLAALVIAVLAAWLAVAFRGASPWNAAAFAVAGFASHVALDLTNAYGTQAFWPFSLRRLAWDWTSIVDLPLIMLALASLLVRLAWPDARVNAAIAALLAMAAYLVFRALIHARLLATVESHYSGLGPIRLSVLPELMGWNRWRYLVDTGTDVFVGLVTWRPRHVHPAHRLQRLRDQVVAASLTAPAVQTFNRFARHPVAEVRQEPDRHIVKWYDARYVVRGYAPFAATVALDLSLQLLDDRLGGVRVAPPT